MTKVRMTYWAAVDVLRQYEDLPTPEEQAAWMLRNRARYFEAVEIAQADVSVDPELEEEAAAAPKPEPPRRRSVPVSVAAPVAELGVEPVVEAPVPIPMGSARLPPIPGARIPRRRTEAWIPRRRLLAGEWADLSAAAQRVLPIAFALLSDHPKKWARFHYPTVARLTGLGRSSIYMALSEAAEKGWIRRKLRVVNTMRHVYIRRGRSIPNETWFRRLLAGDVGKKPEEEEVPVGEGE
uniref:Uncharacterized protein n=2 Tax=viral metagenome TaxID=1070528 RepID=A0A6M3X8D4_9ZZZZ